PAVVPTGVIPGLAVNVNGPAVAPAAVLLTVIVPFFGVVSAVVVVNAGVGPAKAIVAPSTVNVTALLAPVGVETVTAWAPSVAGGGFRGWVVGAGTCAARREAEPGDRAVGAVRGARPAGRMVASGRMLVQPAALGPDSALGVGTASGTLQMVGRVDSWAGPAS